MKVTIDFYPSTNASVEYSAPTTKHNTNLYHSHWNELHLKESPTLEWFNDWVNRIPNYSCSCRANFQEILKQHPPPFSPGKWFEWTVLVHNKVNASLGKPIITLEEAEAIWK